MQVCQVGICKMDKLKTRDSKAQSGVYLCVCVCVLNWGILMNPQSLEDGAKGMGPERGFVIHC